MREGSWKQSNENSHPTSDTLYGNQPHGPHPRYDTRTGKCGTVKNAGVENARPENTAPICRSGKCGI